MSQSFDKCPRCQEDWQPYKKKINKTKISEEIAYDGNDPKIEIIEGILSCEKCNIIFNVVEQVLSIREFLGHERQHLAWFLNDKYCYYGRILSHIVSGKRGISEYGIELPWLPFDITPQKLKLYIFFS